jgi:YHS domain-containing protein
MPYRGTRPRARCFLDQRRTDSFKRGIPPMRLACFLIVSSLVTLVAAAGDDSAPGRLADQAALKAYGGLVGDWRGTGQVKRQSNKGAWLENASWAWKLTKDSAALEFKAKNGKYIKSGVLRPAKTAGSFTLEAILADDSKRTYSGRVGKEDVLALTADGDGDGPRRVTITPLHGTRLLVLLESKNDSGFVRIGEIGYTREGISFAAGDSYPLCIVTEGRGTITVKHQGKTYYVCCSGCKDLFEENPAAVIAEAEARAKKKASEKGK